jgi:excinuclease ABC subunit A
MMRDLYAKEKLSKIRGYLPNTFLSTWMLAVVKLVRRRLYQCRDGIWRMFNCPVKLVMANDLRKSYSEVAFAGKNIHDILTMTIDDAVAF